MPVVEAAPDGVVVVCDADVSCAGIGEAVQAVADGAPWAVPHTLVQRLTQEATRNVLSGRTDDTIEQAPYWGVLGGGIVVAQREVILSIPLDRRFVGWGQEDESWGWALLTLLGEPWRGTADLTHYWHPPQDRIDRVHGSREGWALRRRYAKARHDPTLMRALVEEGRHEPDQPPEPGLHDHQPLAVGHP